MTQSYYSLITNNGLLKEAAASSGSPVNLTHIAVGDANGTSYNPTGSQTALVHETYRTTLTHVAIDETNPNQLIVEAVINETVGPFYIREVGIFDSDGELFAIGKYPETYKSTSEIGSGKRLYIRMILGFTNAPQVNLVMSEDLNNDPNFNANVIIALALKLAKAANLSDVEDAGEARENLGLEIGVNVQAFAANLAAFASLIGAANKTPYFTGAGALALSDLITALTSSELRTGTNTAKMVTAAAVLAALGFTSYFQSSQQTITLGGGLTLAHGLPRTPILYKAFLVCTDAGGEAGYTQNQETPMLDSDLNTAGGGSTISMVPDGTNIVCRYGSAAIYVLNKSTGAYAAITVSKWKCIIRAWA